jgi:hypothetical protein
LAYNLRSICVQKWMCGAWSCDLLMKNAFPLGPIVRFKQISKSQSSLITLRAVTRHARGATRALSSNFSLCAVPVVCVFVMILVPCTFKCLLLCHEINTTPMGQKHTHFLLRQITKPCETGYLPLCKNNGGALLVFGLSPHLFSGSVGFSRNQPTSHHIFREIRCLRSQMEAFACIMFRSIASCALTDFAHTKLKRKVRENVDFTCRFRSGNLLFFSVHCQLFVLVSSKAGI